ncbi:hypothetical protein LTR96_011938, partial [Exophiala xenobiotica]
ETKGHHGMTSLGVRVDLAEAKLGSTGYAEDVSQFKERLEATERNITEANAETDRLSNMKLEQSRASTS